MGVNHKCTLEGTVANLLDRMEVELVEKVVESAAANAENNFDLDRENLYVAEISANQGPTMKRWRAGAKGRGMKILKRSSHISVVLKEKGSDEEETEA